MPYHRYLTVVVVILTATAACSVAPVNVAPVAPPSATATTVEEVLPIRLVSRVIKPVKAIDPALKDYLKSLSPDVADVHAIMQFQQLPDAGMEQNLGRRSVELLDTIPERAYLARIPADLGALRDLVSERSLSITYVGFYAPTDKLAPAFRGIRGVRFPDYAASKDGFVEAVVLFFGDVDIQEQQKLLSNRKVGNRQQYRSLNGWRVLVTEEQINELASLDAVKWIQPGQPPPRDDNDGARSPTGLDSDALYPATPEVPDDYNLTGEDVVVAQFEFNNASTTHSDLVERISIGDSTVPAIALYSRTHMHDDRVDHDIEFDQGEVIYVDMDDSETVSIHDWRVSAGATSLPLGGVLAGDPELATPLVAFRTYPLFESFVDNPSSPNFFYDEGEEIYRDEDRYFGGGERVSGGDIRLIDISAGGNNHAAGSTVNAADADVGRPLFSFPFRPHKHATHVAATLAGDGTASDQHPLTGAACDSDRPTSVCNAGTEKQWQGLAPEARIVSFRTKNLDQLLQADCSADPGGCSDGLADDYPTAFEHGATISSNSWGWDWRFYCASEWQFALPVCDGANIDDAIAAQFAYDAFAAHYDALVSGRQSDGSGTGYENDQRILLVTSAGNFGHTRDWRTIRFTNSAKNTLTVGNVTSDTNVLWETSSRGPTLDGRIKPDVVGPGSQSEVEFPPAPPEPAVQGGIYSARPVNHYYSDWGTSMSTPAISGTVALLTEWYRRVCDNQEPSPGLLKAALVQSAQDLTIVPGVSGDYPHADYAFGFGLPKAQAAIDVITHSIEGKLCLDEPEKTYDLYIGASTDLKVTLSWADPAWFPGALPSEDHGLLHNDLDLELVYKPGTADEYTYLPWTRDPNDELGDADRAVDSRNTVEQALVQNAQPGHWQVRVKNSQLAQPPQDFVLVGEMLPEALGQCVAESIVAREDVWAKDHSQDDGTVPTSGAVWMSEDVWNHFTGPITGAHQNPVAGRQNRLYLLLRNRGAIPAAAVSADIWVAPAGVGISWPASFEYVGRINVPSLGTGAAPQQVGPLVWIPQRPKLASDYSFYVRLSSPGDPIPADVESGSLYQNVTKSNNLIWRNVHLVELQRATTMGPARGPWTGYAEFMMRNPNDGRAEVSIEAGLGRSVLDQGLEVIVEFDAEDLRGVDRLRMQMVGLDEVPAPRTGGLLPAVRRFRLTTQTIRIEQFTVNPKESVPVRLFFSSPNRLTAIHEFTIEQRIRAKLTGGITYRLKMAN